VLSHDRRLYGAQDCLTSSRELHPVALLQEVGHRGWQPSQIAHQGGSSGARDTIRRLLAVNVCCRLPQQVCWDRSGQRVPTSFHLHYAMPPTSLLSTSPPSAVQ